MMRAHPFIPALLQGARTRVAPFSLVKAAHVSHNGVDCFSNGVRIVSAGRILAALIVRLNVFSATIFNIFGGKRCRILASE
jgi:hypothetical protein